MPCSLGAISRACTCKPNTALRCAHLARRVLSPHSRAPAPPPLPWRSVTALHLELGTRFWLRMYQAGTTTQADYRELTPQPTAQGRATFALTVSGGNYDAQVETSNDNGNGGKTALQRDIAVGEAPAPAASAQAQASAAAVGCVASVPACVGAAAGSTA